MLHSQPGLGTALRHLIDLLDGDVHARYLACGLNYRPRYTPVVKALAHLGEGSIKSIASHAGMTHSAVSQTVAQMAKNGLVERAPGGNRRANRDGRENIVRAAPALTTMMPRLREIWAATDQAARGLDAELSFPLSALLQEAIAALTFRSFGERMHDAEAASC